MIRTKKELKEYIYADEIARFGHKASIIEKIKMGDLWRYNVVLRRLEFLLSNKRRVRSVFYKILLRHYSKTTGWSIAPFNFGKGLCVVHRGTLVVNNKVRIGAWCRCHVCVNIGADEDGSVPCIGDNVYIGPGAKIFGDITIGSNIKIGANAVVNKSFINDKNKGLSIAGVPAKIVRIYELDEYSN